MSSSSLVGHGYTLKRSKKKRLFLFCFVHQTLYGTVLQHDSVRPHATLHTTQFLANIILILPWPSVSPDGSPNKHNWNELEGRVRGGVIALAKYAWIVWGTRAGVGGHPSSSDSQPDPVHAWEMLSGYWFTRKTHPVLICMSLSRKIPRGSTNSWTRKALKSCKTWINWKTKFDELDFLLNFLTSNQF